MSLYFYIDQDFKIYRPRGGFQYQHHPSPDSSNPRKQGLETVRSLSFDDVPRYPRYRDREITSFDDVPRYPRSRDSDDVPHNPRKQGLETVRSPSFDVPRYPRYRDSDDVPRNPHKQGLETVRSPSFDEVPRYPSLYKLFNNNTTNYNYHNNDDDRSYSGTGNNRSHNEPIQKDIQPQAHHGKVRFSLYEQPPTAGHMVKQKEVVKENIDEVVDRFIRRKHKLFEDSGNFND